MEAMSATIVSFLLTKIQDLPSTLVYVLVAVLVFGEAALFVGFVLPGETAVIVAGVVAARGQVNIVALCVIVVLSAILGDSVGYFVGERYGKRLVGSPLLASRRAGFDRALEGLTRRGATYVFVGRFTAFLRAVIPSLAGMSKLRYRRFLAANAAGALVWGVLYALLGYYAGHALDAIEKYSGWGATGLLALVVIVVVVVHLRRRRRDAKEKLERRNEPPGTDSAQDLE
jgi:membrane protein DedA with SNARE-associated domain